MSRTLQRLACSCVLACALAGCSRQIDTLHPVAHAEVRKQVSVAAAADLKFAFDELIGQFEQESPEIRVQVTYGSSGNFFAQLTNRAPFDIYFSADMTYPRQLVKNGMADKESEFLYAIGQIVVWLRNESPLDVEKLGIESLRDPTIRKIAIANPQHAPYGRAAEAALQHFDLTDAVQDKLVFGENVAQTAQFVESGAADVGIIALSLAKAPALRDKGRYWLVPLDAYPKMEQGSVILNWAKDRQATERFRSFVAGPKGREILARYGFILPEG